MEPAIRHWMICEVRLTRSMVFRSEMLMLSSWELRRAYGRKPNVSRLGNHYISSMYTDRDSTLLLPNMDARTPLHETMGTKTVCAAPRW
jgi:hypothetical protein